VTKHPVPARDPASPRRFDPFRVLPAAERRRHLAAYRSWLEARNGEIDLPQRRLSRRERYFAGIERQPVAWRGAVDREGFRQWLAGAGRPALDPRMLFLVVVGKVNESERYGIDLELERFEKRGEHLADLSQLYVFLEEGYHSRLLIELCRTCGVDLELRTPPWSTRWLISLIRYLPERVRWIPVLCGEVVGCAVFRLLMDHCHLFAGQPEVEARVRALLGEIWLDEALHVAFVRARLGPLAIRLSRLMLPLVALSLTKHVPALAELGLPRAALLARVRAGFEVPPQAEWIEPAPALAG